MESVVTAVPFKEACQEGWFDPKWYVLFVRSNQEKRVSQHLMGRGIEHFLPVFDSVRQWRDRKVRLQYPLFPGYVFIRLPLTERLKALVVPHVLNLVGTRSVPSVISDEEIEWMKRGVAYGKPEPHPYLKVGSWVVIKEGAMAGLEGILLREKNSTRVLIGLDCIARAFAVEVESKWIEPAAPRTPLSYAC